MPTMQQKWKRMLCDWCARDNCINRGNEEIVNEERYCYERTKCGQCPVFHFCKSKHKDKLKHTDDFSIEECFEPIASCSECCMQSECQNKDLGIPFKLNFDKHCKPQCFNGKE